MKIVYSLKIMLALAEKGIIPEKTMKNPRWEQFNCWLYNDTPEFYEAFNQVQKELKDKSEAPA